ncbi:MAG TPA: hypothetical protein VLV89_12920, partial [Candidatus Acidoferrum sp.]|nr:hypothetical protein [Candidatus Acidoferrum sp.]
LRLADGTLIQPTDAIVVHNDSLLKEVQYSFPRIIGETPVLSPGEPGLLFELGANLPTYIKTKKGHFKQPLPFRFSGNTCGFVTSNLMYKGKLEY